MYFDQQSAIAIGSAWYQQTLS
jgi:hypothetical protein